MALCRSGRLKVSSATPPRISNRHGFGHGDTHLNHASPGAPPIIDPEAGGLGEALRGRRLRGSAMQASVCGNWSVRAQASRQREHEYAAARSDGDMLPALAAEADRTGDDLGAEIDPPQLLAARGVEGLEKSVRGCRQRPARPPWKPDRQASDGTADAPIPSCPSADRTPARRRSNPGWSLRSGTCCPSSASPGLYSLGPLT